VTAAAVGSAVITATSGGRSGTSNVSVHPAPPPPAAVAQVRVTPGTLTIHSGQTRNLTATAFDAASHPLTGRTITWTTSGSNAVTLTQTGAGTAKVTGSGIGLGVTLVTATCEGVSGSSVVTFVL
jgi:hypothetical protein